MATIGPVTLHALPRIIEQADGSWRFGCTVETDAERATRIAKHEIKETMMAGQGPAFAIVDDLQPLSRPRWFADLESPQHSPAAQLPVRGS